MKKSRSQPAAYSYVRFSHPDQAKGDSLRRQTEATEAWCRKNGVPLDTSLSLRDLGVSAFKGKHRSDKAALGHFLEAVRQGRVPKGSYLVIENLDRLSREEERTALRLWLDILDAGVNIVQLQPETIFRHERSDMTDIIRAIIELSRGHSESQMKSIRVSAAWDGKFEEAGRGKVLTRTLPAWVQETGGCLELIPERASVVRKIFRLAATGYGHTTIVQKLRKEGIPAFGSSGDWTRAYINKILSDRRAVGELQPRLTKATQSGQVLCGYYPAAVSEAEFLAARAASTSRRKSKSGRMTGGPDGCANLFGGLLRNVRDGGSYTVALRGNNGAYHRVLQAGTHDNGKSPSHSFPLQVFERAVLTMLREIKPEEVLPASPKDDTALIENELQYLRERKTALTDELLKGDVGAIATALRQIEAREVELQDKIRDSQDEQAKPLAETWQDAQSLADLLDGTEDIADVRLRLRTAIRRLVEVVWVFVASSGRDRIAAVEVVFVGQTSRRYWLWAKPKGGYKHGGTRPGRWWACSLKTGTGDLSGLHNLSGKERERATARFEAGLVPAVITAVEADLKARELLKDDPAALAELDRVTRTGVIG